MNWASGNTKTIPIGSRVILLRQGVDPRGIIATGWTTGEVEELPHWDHERADRGDVANFVWFAFEDLLDPNVDELLSPKDFPPGPVRGVHWSPFASGTAMPDEAALQLEELLAQHFGKAPVAGEVDEELSALEGKLRYRLVRHRSRERALRKAKIKAAIAGGSLRCEVRGCGFDFAERYGEAGVGYAQVHHLKPLSHTGETQTSLDDLAIVCANCHAIIHRGGKSRELDSLIRS
jgi:hypothetical protein